MAEDHTNSSRTGVLHELSSIGSRAAAATIRPLSGAVGAAAEAGISLERRAMDRLVDSGELERLLGSTRLQAAIGQVLESDGAKRLVDTFFDSGLFDRFVERLLASDALWHLVDEIAASPAVTAAISQQGLGFADQVGGEMRSRSRKADDWLERSARRMIHRHSRPAPQDPDASAR
jgi:hypothetical protein